MRYLFLAAAAVMSPGLAGAQQCSGSATAFRCIEPDGTVSETIIRGPMTTVKGTDPATGESWENVSRKTGKLTKTTGRAADGSKWEWTSQTIGGRTFTHGVDSKGRSFSYYCDQFRCY